MTENELWVFSFLSSSSSSPSTSPTVFECGGGGGCCRTDHGNDGDCCRRRYLCCGITMTCWNIYIYIYMLYTGHTNTLDTVLVHYSWPPTYIGLLFCENEFSFSTKRDVFFYITYTVFAVEWTLSHSLYVYSLYSSSFANRSYIYICMIYIWYKWYEYFLFCWCRFESWVIGELNCYRIGTPLEKSTGTLTPEKIHCTPQTTDTDNIETCRSYASHSIWNEWIYI